MGPGRAGDARKEAGVDEFLVIGVVTGTGARAEIHGSPVQDRFPEHRPLGPMASICL